MENDGYDNRGAGANLNTDDDITVTFLPLVDSERKLLHIHFLSAQEVGPGTVYMYVYVYTELLFWGSIFKAKVWGMHLFLNIEVKTLICISPQFYHITYYLNVF